MMNQVLKNQGIHTSRKYWKARREAIQECSSKWGKKKSRGESHQDKLSLQELLNKRQHYIERKTHRNQS